ncbi:MAG: hypothetical protein ACRERC_18360, partial [Candidatus Binatia bacterium]
MNSFIRRFWRAEGSGRATLGIAFAAVAIVGATLGAFYVYRQLAEAELQERNTRAVSSMAEQLAFRINGLVEATDNVSRGCRDAKAWEVSRCLRGRVLGEIPGASEVASGRRLDWLQSLRPERRDHSPFSVFIDGHSPYPKLLFLFDGSSPRAAFEMDLGDVVSAFTRQQPFESLLLTDAKGKVLYRSGSSTTSLLQLSELLDHVTAPGRLPATDGKRPAADTSAGPNGGPQVDHPPTEAAKHSDNGHSIWAETVEIRGMHSLLRLRTFPDGNDVDELRIVGVVRTGKSVNESTIVPPLFAGALLIAALLLLATWPIVQLVLVAPAERIRRRSVWLIAGGGYFAIGLATFVVFSLIEHDGLRRQFDATAVELARTVADRLCTRLHRASSILQTFEDGGGSMSGSDGSGLLYPFEMFVIAERGEVLRRWRGFPSNIYGRPIHLEVLPAAGVGLADRQYFIDADAGVFASCAEHEEEVGEGFSVEVIRSRTTGRPTVTVAKTTQLDQWDTPDSVARVLAMSVPIMLVGKAVLPPGFAYAVVDRTGETLFHSDPRRAKVEALFAETGSAALEAAVRFRAESEPFTVSYYGAPTRVHVRPILGLDDWSVVVLEDLAYSRTIYGLLVSEWALYFSAYSLALWAVLGGIRLLRPEPRSWLWPRSDRGALYVRSTLLIVLALTAAAPIPFLQPWFTTVAAAIVLPGFVLCVLLVNLRWEIGKGRIAGLLLLVLGALLATNLWFAGWYGEYFAGGVWEWVLLASFPAVVAATPLYRWWFRHRTHAYVGAYVALTFLAFAVLAAVPAAAIFRLACAHALETHVRFSQIEILRDVLDATLRARRAVEGDWPRWVADRLHDT